MNTLIFDLDGTLIDSAPHIFHVSNQLLREEDLPELSLETVSGFIGNGVRKLIERLMRASDVRDYDLEALNARFVEIYLEDPARHTLIYPHVTETLVQLKSKNYQIGICTNKLETLSLKLLEGLPFGASIDTLVGGDTTPALKPDPQPVWEVMRRLGAQPATTFYIGDSETDAKTCEAANLPFGFFEGGYCHVDPATLSPLFSFADYRDLPAILEELGR